MNSARTRALLAAARRAPLTGEAPQPDTAFGCDVFGLDVMRKRLPRKLCKELAGILQRGERLDPSIADAVANAMKDWAVELGATHYTHWFQPMTGLTAEKHDAFLSPAGEGRAISEFSGRTLICGEPDASSFPSGGLRSTFEARGYTAWDPSVPAFILRGPYSATLHIPSFFYSYSGEALDRKIPLLRSIDALSRQAVRILRLFGNEAVGRVTPMVGPEQEYFLVDKGLAALRPDLLLTGRTLIGAPSPKGQEMEDHYFGSIPARVMSFMQDVENALIALGIPAKTRHNEVAPGQFELAPVYEEANIACDHNMLIMNLLRHIAPRHGFLCLLHEKPFAGINGSGKHNNWSLCDSDGQNLLNPGSTPRDNAQFLVFLAAVLRAVHRHAAALRLGAIGAGNDHRLGANEAPPAIISVYLGEQLTEVLDGIVNGRPAAPGKPGRMEIGVSPLPPLPVDLSDRNRTSPFAFTGNKFEFRAVGSSSSIAPANIAVNAAVADALGDIADELEAMLAAGQPLNAALQELLPRMFREHMAVVFNGNGYGDAWPGEAARRGLPNYRDTVEALEHYGDPEVRDLFVRQGILNEREVEARRSILLENYAGTVIIEGRTLADMLRSRVIPEGAHAQKEAAALTNATKEALGDAEAERATLETLRQRMLALRAATDTLEKALAEARRADDDMTAARRARDTVIPAMQACRVEADALERLVDDAGWSLPKYQELLWIH